MLSSLISDPLPPLLTPELPHFGWAAALVFIAALVRGYTGFGFTAVAIAGLNLIWPVHTSVPIILLLDLVASAALLPSGLHNADRALLRTLTIGALAGMPLGLVLLATIDDTLLKLGISILLIVCVLLLLLPARALPESAQGTSLQGNLATGSAGFFSGVAGVAGAAGGLPVVCYLLHRRLPARTQHATLLLFLTGSALVALLLVVFVQPPSTPVVVPAAQLLLPTLAGLGMGFFLFHHRPPQSPRLITVPLLLALASGSLAGAARDWMDTPAQDSSHSIATQGVPHG